MFDPGMPEKISFWTRELSPEKGYWIIQQLSTLSFTLSGFSFTSLSFFIGFYSNNPTVASDIVFALFVCTILFMLSGEMAREGYRIWKYLASETIYLISLSILSISFWLFAARFPSLNNPIATGILGVTIGYFGYRTVHNVFIAIRVR